MEESDIEFSDRTLAQRLFASWQGKVLCHADRWSTQKNPDFYSFREYISIVFYVRKQIICYPFPEKSIIIVATFFANFFTRLNTWFKILVPQNMPFDVSALLIIYRSRDLDLKLCVMSGQVLYVTSQDKIGLIHRDRPYSRRRPFYKLLISYCFPGPQNTHLLFPITSKLTQAHSSFAEPSLFNSCSLFCLNLHS